MAPELNGDGAGAGTAPEAGPEPETDAETRTGTGTATSDRPPAIAVRDLTKAYGDVVANDSLTFEVERGEIFGYLGPNGAGKSTTIRTLMGFQAPTGGTATVLGRDVRDDRALRAAKADVGFLPGNPAFDEDVTGERYLDYLARLKGGSRREELLELFDPPLDRKIREYSTGNRQMLGIVQAFMHDPELVVMDEPTSGLDPLKQERFHSFVRDERDDGKTIFFSSHVLSEVRRVCDRVAILRNGRLVTLERVESLLERGGKRVTMHTADGLTEADLAIDGIAEFTMLDDGARFVYTGEYDDLVSFLSAHSIVEIEIEEPPLEDVFMHYYGEASDGDDGTGEAATDGTNSPDERASTERSSIRKRPEDSSIEESHGSDDRDRSAEPDDRDRRIGSDDRDRQTGPNGTEGRRD